MPLTETNSDEPVLVTRKLVERMDAELTRLAKKLDNAQGFAVNNSDTLTAKPAVTSTTPVVIEPTELEGGLRGQCYMTLDDIGTVGWADPFFTVQRNPTLYGGEGGE